MNSALKFGSAILVAGGIATGVGFGIQSQSSLPKPKIDKEVKPEIKEDVPKPEIKKVSVRTLINKKFRLLEENEEDGTKWDQNWERFRKDYAKEIPENINGFWNFADWANTKELSNTPVEFKNKCTKSNEENVTGEEDPLFVVFKNYCLVEKEESQVEK